MAASDGIGDIEEIASGAYQTIQPSVETVHWIVRNLAIPEGVEAEVYLTNGTKDVLLWTTVGPITNMPIYVNQSIYLKVKNLDSSAQNLGYNGVVIK